MIDALQAQSIVLGRCNANNPTEKFAIQSCEFSGKWNCWVIRANSEDYVLHGRFEQCYVGVNAYLVDKESGSIEIVGSAQSIDEYLQDRDDLQNAAGRYYVLEPAFDRNDKPKVILLKQALDYSLPTTLQMLTPHGRYWLTGKLRILKVAQALLDKYHIPTKISLQQSLLGATEIDEGVWHWDALKVALKSNFTQTPRSHQQMSDEQ